MAVFLNIAAGEEKTAPGLRVSVRQDGEAVWMHGKWLDLGPDHAVAWIDGEAIFERPDGRRLFLGEFPGWIVRSSVRGGAAAIMFNKSQFEGGALLLRNGRKVRKISIH